MAGLDPLQLNASEFLALYLVLLAAAAVIGWIVPPWLRPEGKALSLHHPFEIACLSGGTARYAETLVVGLMQAGHLAVGERDGIEPLHPAAGLSSAEVTVLGLPKGTDWNTLVNSLWNAANWIEWRLIARGLWMSRAEWWEVRGWACLLYILTLLFGAIRWEVGLLRHQPVPYLSALLILTLVAGVVRCLTIDRRTRAGTNLLARLRDEADWLRQDRRMEQAPLAVALFGTEVLIGTPYEALHRMRRFRRGDAWAGDGGGGNGGGGGDCGDGGGCGD